MNFEVTSMFKVYHVQNSSFTANPLSLKVFFNRIDLTKKTVTLKSTYYQLSRRTVPMKRGLYSAFAIGAATMMFGQVAEATNTTTYTVKNGDSLGLIAQKYDTSAKKLQKLNHLTSDRIYVSQKLKVPTSNTSSKKPASAKKPASSTSTYTVKSGDSLGLIAVKYNMSIAKLKKLNNLSSDFIYVSQKLKVTGKDVTSKNPAPSKKPAPTPAPPKKPASSTSTKTYSVASGDSLGLIAAKYNMTVASLKSLNNLKSDMIFVGQKLKVKGSTTTIPASKGDKDNSSTEKVSYSTQRILKIAEKYTGVPYVFGGSTPNGFDCSGYIYYVYKEAGLDLGGRKTAAGYASMARSVSSPKIGDLVFFEGTYAGMEGRISHVGIYLGNNKFISALSKGIGISDLKYWQDSFVRYGRF